MLRIRLQRSGRKRRPNYRIVVAEHSAPIQGRYVDAIGTFDPLIEKHGLVVDETKVEEWIKKGAKPTNTVARLLKGKGVKGMEPFIVEMKDRKVKNPKDTPEEKTAPASEATESSTDAGGEAPAAPVAEAPAAEGEAPAETPAEPAPAEEKPAAEESAAEEAQAPDEEEKKEEEAPAEQPSEDDNK